MKRFLCAALAALLLFSLAACGTGEKKDRPFTVVATIFPLYDWTRCLLGERAGTTELKLLLDGGVDMHSFQPTVNDIIAVTDCDVLIYVGGESDEWIEKALKDSAKPGQIRVNLLSLLGPDALQEELREGMEGENDGASDEHIWLSPRLARRLCGLISDALREADPEHAAVYEAAFADYDALLARLDADYAAAVESASGRTLLFADRFPFRYLTEDYGLDYYAAFAGCSSETQASFSTVIFLANKLDELGLDCVCVIENSDGKLARQVIESSARTDRRILTLHSMQGAVNGESYLSLMEKNLAVLKEALG
ncbi:MAG: metal ABC transporter substrate-binding protein [Oscillospiraceae bacterium]|nr:metal ABC transporter substrate-binding protein [Oscillospiraceae bacterium]